jgi:hypothetical protein
MVCFDRPQKYEEKFEDHPINVSRPGDIRRFGHTIESFC